MKLPHKLLVVLLPVTIEVIWQIALLSQFRNQIWEKRSALGQSDTKLSSGLFTSPFVLVLGQCDGGSAVADFIHILVQAHGFKTVAGFDFFTDDIDPRSGNFKNEFYQDILKEKNLTTDGGLHREALVGSLGRAQSAAQDLHRIFFFQANPEQIQEFRQELDAMGASYTRVFRENAFDRCICQVRGCIVNETYGYPVFAANGTKANLCNPRKKELDGATIQAKLIDTKGCIQSNLQYFNQTKESALASTSFENLFEFQASTNDDGFQQSADTWIALLEPLLKDHLDKDLVLTLLEQYRGTQPPKSQKKAVYNFEFVRQQLEGTGDARYLRP